VAVQDGGNRATDDLNRSIVNIDGVLNLQDLKMTDHKNNDWKLQYLENEE